MDNPIQEKISLKQKFINYIKSKKTKRKVMILTNSQNKYCEQLQKFGEACRQTSSSFYIFEELKEDKNLWQK